MATSPTATPIGTTTPACRWRNRRGQLDGASSIPTIARRPAPAWLTAAAGGRPYEVEFPLRRADGEYRWFLSRAQPVRDADGTLRSWIGTSLDIHERKVAEERFQALTELAPAVIWFGNPTAASAT